MRQTQAKTVGFVARLRAQAQKCGFEEERIKEEVLQMLIWGTNSQQLRDKLLNDDPGTLNQAIVIGNKIKESKRRAKVFTEDSKVARVKSGKKIEGKYFDSGFQGY